MEGPCLLLLGSWIIMYLSKPETGKLLLANTLLLFPKFTTRSRVLVHCSSSTSVTIFCCSHILWHCWAQVCRIANSCYLSTLNATLFLPSSLHLHPEWEAFLPGGMQMLNFNPFENIQTHFMTQNTACLDMCSRCSWKECVFCFVWVSVLWHANDSSLVVWVPLFLLIFCLLIISITWN